MPVAIHSTELGASGPRVAFLHGLFGQGKNFTASAKALRDSCRVTLLDLPNHGRSGWTERFSYPETAAAIGNQLTAASPDPVNLVGHSMGGKVGMVLAILQPDLVERLCVVDVAPVRYQTQSSFGEYIQGLRSVDLDRLPDRATADAALRPYVPDDVVRAFLLQNLRREQTPDGPRWHWQLNLDIDGSGRVGRGFHRGQSREPREPRPKETGVEEESQFRHSDATDTCAFRGYAQRGWRVAGGPNPHPRVGSWAGQARRLWLGRTRLPVSCQCAYRGPSSSSRNS